MPKSNKRYDNKTKANKAQTKKRALKLNTISSLVFEIVTIISGIILPRLIIGQYGSDVNGLVNSITQFIGVVAFLELGVGKVVQSALYKPLVQKSNEQISKIVVSAKKFFNRIAAIMVAYIVAVIIFFPLISEGQFGWIYTVTLLIAISVSSFAQYYFGIVDRLLLTADQRGYVQYIAQATTLILNTIACIILINLNCSIQAVKIVSSFIFLLRPLFLMRYVRKNYDIDYKAKYEEEPIKQKWNGMAQHIAYTVLNDTDVIVLTILGSFSDVSVYAVYNLIVSGIKKLFTSLMNGVEAYLGHLWAKKDEDGLQKTFELTEWAIHTAVIYIFGCTGFLIISFVQCYTNGVTDANYIQPLFATLIVAAHACHCLRLPYNLMIFAAGHYKQTQHNYIIAAIMNIVISVACVKQWGLVGVAIGTLVSMLYQTIWMAFYNAKNLVKRSIRPFMKQCCIDAVTIGVYFAIPFPRELSTASYYSWIALALVVSLTYFIITVGINFVFYRQKLITLKRHLLNKAPLNSAK